MRIDAERMKDEMGDKRKEDAAIRPFTIEIQENI